MRDYVLIYINGKRYTIIGDKAFQSLAYYLRNEASLTGTKIVCAEGDCGSCTVLRAFELDKTDRLYYETINSCIAPIYSLDGASIVTVEGVSQDQKLSPIQRAMVEHHGSQCGFCTPGFVCSLTALFEHKDHPSEKSIKNYCTGNLCRCTGYRSIIDAAKSVDPSQVIRLKDRYHSHELWEDIKKHKKIPMQISYDGVTFYGPKSLHQALELKKKHADAILFAGGTDLGVQINKRRAHFRDIICLNGVEELQKIEEDKQAIFMGAGVRFTDFEKIIARSIPELCRFIRVFASGQIKNAATLIGNIANASPIGDSMPALLVLDSTLEIQSLKGQRKLSLKDLYNGYKTLNLDTDEIITGVHINKPKKSSVFKLYKVAKRKDLDISTVSSALYIELDRKVITKVRLAYGGVAAYPLRISQIENHLVGKSFTQKSFNQAAQMVGQVMQPLSDHRGSARYRLDLAANLIRRSFFESKMEG